MNLFLVGPNRPLWGRVKEELANLEEITQITSGETLDEAITNMHEGASIDVIIINADETGISDTESWRILRRLFPNTLLMAIISSRNTPAIDAAFGADLSSLHPAKVSPVRLAEAIRTVASGNVDHDVDMLKFGMRRSPDSDSDAVINLGGLTIDPERQVVHRWGTEIQLSPLRFKVLTCLARRASSWVSTEELLKEVWETPVALGGTAAQVKNCIRALREKIEPVPRKPRYIQSRRGWGYSLRDPLGGD